MTYNDVTNHVFKTLDIHVLNVRAMKVQCGGPERVFKVPKSVLNGYDHAWVCAVSNCLNCAASMIHVCNNRQVI